jgi:hypothetical protein
MGAHAGGNGMFRGQAGYAQSESRKARLLVLCARIGFTPPQLAS